MLVSTNYHNHATHQFKGFIVENLRNIYGKSGIKLAPNTLIYKMYNDSDKMGVEEVATFTMTDGKRYSVYYEHKGFNSFQLVK